MLGIVISTAYRASKIKTEEFVINSGQGASSLGPTVLVTGARVCRSDHGPTSCEWKQDIV